ncbi:MAG: excinuclease ABC subunit UvrC [Candidatus Cardinium sp.]|uniref:excinuclease ABC subunit UvrC n=1 Tax=Candidatus Cardinium sp. TP TaxID=2961955 RepID=UPI0021B0648B|nr:excinuclease ABC subunit UvrC [Candidatus Cardinium sp. TP]MCT4697113.1 excinuclease ABC subunit UvrC [Candidatus Cardinium sp. TP]MDN5247107.1 excinuclease ABC subunit UvrC [Candidatus Cardinium sp.]
METPRYTPNQIQHLPTLPGIYLFYNHKEEVIYVGKAKNIKKRVSDYFAISKVHNLKTARMVTHIASIAYTALHSEYEALLLENNLIKALQPRYNILLKDGKTYPYLCITHDRFPKVIITRKTVPPLGKYYGPFTSAQSVKQTLEVIKKLFTFRTCNYNLSAANITNHKFKVCLDYHLGHCKGPCEAFQNEAAYQQEIDQIEALLKNNFASVKKELKKQMLAAAQQLDYKQAQRFKEKLMLLDQYQAKSLVINPLVGDLDVVAIISDPNHAFVGYLHIKQGAISFTQHRVVTKKLEEEATDLLPLVVCSLRACSNSQAPEVLVNLPLNLTIGPFSITMPKIGDKRKLVALALQNALLCKKDFLHQKSNFQVKPNLTLVQLQHDLKLKEVPYWIECFDNSNIQGAHPVAAMVCFKDGKPSKKDYRHYHIKTVVGPDDCASMYEIIQRRYSSKTQEGLPDLIVIDGGKGQLNAALRALEAVGIYGQVAIISIAKRLEELYFPHDPFPLYLNKQSASLKLLQQLRNEAHRFAITFHRKQRSKSAFESLNIPGIGPQTFAKLLQQLGSLQTMQTASLETLATIVGPSKAKRLQAYFLAEPTLPKDRLK